MFSGSLFHRILAARIGVLGAGATFSAVQKPVQWSSLGYQLVQSNDNIVHVPWTLEESCAV